MKWNPVTDKEPKNERLSSGALKRMEGLVTISSKKKMVSVAYDIMSELEDEGFDKDEIIEYLQQVISREV